MPNGLVQRNISRTRKPRCSTATMTTATSATMRMRRNCSRSQQWMERSEAHSFRRSSEDEEHRTKKAEPCPEEIELHRLMHVENGERNEDRQRHDLLHDLQLRQRELMKPDAIGRNLQQILKKRNPPTGKCRHVPRTRRQVAQMGIPGERHEDVRSDEKTDGDDDRTHRRDGNAAVWGSGTRSFATPTGIGRFGEAPGNNNQPTGTLIFASSRMRTMAFLRRAKNESPE